MAGRIATVGELMLDVFVATGGRHGPIRVRAGGTPVNAALAAGAGALVIGRVGDDDAAHAIRHALAGVDTRLVVDETLPTGTYVELPDGTVRADRGANAALSADDVLPLAADAVLVSGYAPRDAASEILARADARWRAVIATPLEAELPTGANVLFANEEEAARIQTDGYEIVVVTRGARGASVIRDGEVRELDPSGLTGTGAGDAFAGRFLAGL